MSPWWFNFISHNELHEITAQLLSKVCNDISIEPPLQPLSGERLTSRRANQQDDARADIHTLNFWGRQQSAFFDIRVFYPNAQSYRKTSISSIYIDATSFRRSESMETASVKWSWPHLLP